MTAIILANVDRIMPFDERYSESDKECQHERGHDRHKRRHLDGEEGGYLASRLYGVDSGLTSDKGRKR